MITSIVEQKAYTNLHKRPDKKFNSFADKLHHLRVRLVVQALGIPMNDFMMQVFLILAVHEDEEVYKLAVRNLNNMKDLPSLRLVNP